jgi:hypothetical protein
MPSGRRSRLIGLVRYVSVVLERTYLIQFQSVRHLPSYMKCGMDFILLEVTTL